MLSILWCVQQLAAIIMMIPLQATSVGSGSHSPLLIHMVELGPVRTRSDAEQVNVMTVPSLAGLISLEGYCSMESSTRGAIISGYLHVYAR